MRDMGTTRVTMKNFFDGIIRHFLLSEYVNIESTADKDIQLSISVTDSNADLALLTSEIVRVIFEELKLQKYIKNYDRINKKSMVTFSNIEIQNKLLLTTNISEAFIMHLKSYTSHYSMEQVFSTYIHTSIVFMSLIKQLKLTGEDVRIGAAYHNKRFSLTVLKKQTGNTTAKRQITQLLETLRSEKKISINSTNENRYFIIYTGIKINSEKFKDSKSSDQASIFKPCETIVHLFSQAVNTQLEGDANQLQTTQASGSTGLKAPARSSEGQLPRLFRSTLHSSSSPTSSSSQPSAEQSIAATPTTDTDNIESSHKPNK